MRKVSIFSIVMGIILAIIIQTGFDVEPEGILQYAVGAIISAFATVLGLPLLSAVWDMVVIVLAVYGIIQGIRTVRRILSYGIPGVITGVSGFLGGFVVILFSSNSLAGWAFLALAGISVVTSAVFEREPALTTIAERLRL